MAKLRKQILGEVSGTLGTFIFRDVKGKNVIGVKPSNVNFPKDQLSVDRRSKFALSSKLSAAILADSRLKKLWKEQTPSDLYVQNYIVRQNYRSVMPQSLSDLVKIVPEVGFPINVTGVNKSATQLRVMIEALNSDNRFKQLNDTKVIMSSILFLSNPVDTSVAEVAFLSAATGPQVLDIITQLSFTAELDGPSGIVYNKYQDHKMFFVILTTDDDENVVQFSNTFVG